MSDPERPDYQARCAALEQDLRELSAAIAHDLRAPVRALDGFSRALVDDAGGDPDEQRRHLQFIRESARRLGQQIDALVGLCRLSVVELRVQPVDLSALAGNALADLAAADPGRSVEVQVEADLSAVGDPDLLRVLMESLIGNAWKFSRAEPQARIRVGQREQGGRRAFFVSDSGAGFAMSNASRLFLPFSRLHPPAQFPGLGVGLARARRAVLRHGGRIWPESTPGGGATFWFVLGPT